MLIFKYLLLLLTFVGVCILEACILPIPFSQITILCTGLIFGYFAATIREDN